MFIGHLYREFHIPTSNGSLVTAVKSKAKYTYIFQTPPDTAFQQPTTDGASFSSTSEVYMTTILALFMVEN